MGNMRLYVYMLLLNPTLYVLYTKTIKLLFLVKISAVLLTKQVSYSFVWFCNKSANSHILLYFHNQTVFSRLQN